MAVEYETSCTAFMRWNYVMDYSIKSEQKPHQRQEQEEEEEINQKELVYGWNMRSFSFPAATSTTSFDFLTLFSATGSTCWCRCRCVGVAVGNIEHIAADWLINRWRRNIPTVVYYSSVVAVVVVVVVVVVAVTGQLGDAWGRRPTPVTTSDFANSTPVDYEQLRTDFPSFDTVSGSIEMTSFACDYRKSRTCLHFD